MSRTRNGAYRQKLNWRSHARAQIQREANIGIDANGAKFLAFAKSIGVDFTATAMIGRQNLYVTPDKIRALLATCGIHAGEAEGQEICLGAGGYSETLFHFLGAETTHSFDYSDYESPTHLHDMNEPIPDGFKEMYTALLDGGSLEHVFNFPVAIKNCMEMVKIDGHYLGITPANNFFGHGFYQFSPELYFTVLSPENGFEIVRMMAFEEITDPVWYAVKSPRKLGERVTLENSHPVYLLVVARKVARVPIFGKKPQQSDYISRWSAGPAKAAEAHGVVGGPVKRPITVRVGKRLLPSGVRKRIRAMIDRPAPSRSGFDPRFFERMDWPA